MVEMHFYSDGYYPCVTVHHKHMKLVKQFAPHVIAWFVKKGSIRRFIERKSRKRDCNI